MKRYGLKNDALDDGDKLSAIFDVSQKRELLLAFLEHVKTLDKRLYRTIYEHQIHEDFLKDNNCS